MQVAVAEDADHVLSAEDGPEEAVVFGRDRVEARAADAVDDSAEARPSRRVPLTDGARAAPAAAGTCSSFALDTRSCAFDDGSCALGNSSWRRTWTSTASWLEVAGDGVDAAGQR